MARRYGPRLVPRVGDLAAVAVGGAAGSVVRWGVAEALDPSVTARDWPWATLVVNVVGAGLLGWLVATDRSRSPRWQAALATGFCGGLTTMSALAVELAELGTEGRVVTSVVYLVVTVATGVGAAALAAGAGRRFGGGT